MYYGGYINNPARLEMGITTNAYLVCQMIDRLSKFGEGWCTLSRENMAKDIGLSKQSIINIVDKLDSLFLIQKNSAGNTRSTPKFRGILAKHEAARKEYFEGKKEKGIGKESLPVDGKESLSLKGESVKKVYHSGKESLPEGGKESLPNNSNKKLSITYTLTNGERKCFSVQDYCKLFGMPMVSQVIKENFTSLSDEKKILIAKHLPKYIEFAPAGRYRKSPLNYLLDETYLSPLIDRRENGKTISMQSNPTQIPPSSTKYRYVN